MSFLNPVNEPVLRFSSTDADAPQINYNARTAGDVKAVLKWGLTQAGWTAVNEINHVCEFISPSAAMGKYVLGINDSSASSTEWYYTDNDVRVNPVDRHPTKSFSDISRTSPQNGWQLFITDRGLYFVELVYSTAVSDISARLTFFGQSKPTLYNAVDNIGFFQAGHSSASASLTHLFLRNVAKNTKIGNYTDLVMTSLFRSLNSDAEFIVDVDVVSPIWLTNYAAILGEQAGLLARRVASRDSVYGAVDDIVSNRPVFMFCLGVNVTGEERYLKARPVAIRTDYWEY
ncbi:hypothetical protein ACTXNA_07185 [Psychrobacter celer]|uniref:hypothetical protein n=1 Tax=Psychrobacter celer TaxID=306572 RepID=UPI003FD2BA0B